MDFIFEVLLFIVLPCGMVLFYMLSPKEAAPPPPPPLFVRRFKTGALYRAHIEALYRQRHPTHQLRPEILKVYFDDSEQGYDAEADNIKNNAAWIEPRLKFLSDLTRKAPDVLTTKYDPTPSLFSRTILAPNLDIPGNFTKGNPQFYDVTITEPHNISPETWFASTWVCAPQGKGKTNLLHNIIKDRRPHGTIVIMDAKGELAAPYQSRIIAPDTEYLNPFDLGHSVELLEYVLSSLLEAKMTALQSTLFSYILELKPRNLDHFIELVKNPLPDDEYNSKTYAETKQQLLWRSRLLTRNQHIREMLSAPTTFSMQALCNSRDVVVIDNNPDVLGDMGAEFFGRLMLSLLWAEVRSRAARGGEKTPVYFFIDEAQTVIYRDENIPRLIHQCRSQNVALIFAHQEMQQMKSEDVKGALTNCAIRLAAPQGEIPEFASRLRVDPVFLDTLPPYHFALSLRNEKPVAVTVPLLNLPPAQRRRQTPYREPTAAQPSPAPSLVITSPVKPPDENW